MGVGVGRWVVGLGVCETSHTSDGNISGSATYTNMKSTSL